jgi:hypothetical protein
MFFTKGRRTGFTEMALDHLVQPLQPPKGITSKSDNGCNGSVSKVFLCNSKFTILFNP